MKIQSLTSGHSQRRQINTPPPKKKEMIKTGAENDSNLRRWKSAVRKERRPGRTCPSRWILKEAFIRTSNWTNWDKCNFVVMSLAARTAVATSQPHKGSPCQVECHSALLPHHQHSHSIFLSPPPLPDKKQLPLGSAGFKLQREKRSGGRRRRWVGQGLEGDSA